MYLSKAINVVALFFILTIFSGCVSKYNLIYKNPYENTIRVTGAVKEITITDLRKNVSNREVEIPATTFPGMNDEVSKMLNESTNTLIKNEVAKQFSANSDTTYNVEVRLIRGTIGFRAYAFSEKEYTDIEIEILAKDQFDNSKTFKSSIYIEVSSYDASPKFLLMLFERGLINAIHKSFKLRDK